VKIEGSRPGNASIRYLLESDDMTYCFKGHAVDGGEISVIVPPLKNMLKEGIYNTSLEVIVDDRIFTPLKFAAKFEKSVSVQAESVKVPRKRKVDATATLITESNVKKPSRKKEKNVVTDEDIRNIISTAVKRAKRNK